MLNHSIYHFEKSQRVKSLKHETLVYFSFFCICCIKCEMISFHCLEPDLPTLEDWFKLVLCNLSVVSLGASACDKSPWFGGVSVWFKCWIRGASAWEVFKCIIGTIKSSLSGIISLLRSLAVSGWCWGIVSSLRSLAASCSGIVYFDKWRMDRIRMSFCEFSDGGERQTWIECLLTKTAGKSSFFVFWRQPILIWWFTPIDNYIVYHIS